MSQGVISLECGSKQRTWRYPKGEIVSKIMESFQHAVMRRDEFLSTFVQEMDKKFQSLRNPKGQTLLCLSIEQDGDDWNVTLTKFGLKLQTYRSSDISLIRKSSLSFEDF